MENVSIHWARDLPASTRSAIEGLLGRNLRDDEEVSVMSLASHPAPSGDERRLSALSPTTTPRRASPTRR